MKTWLRALLATKCGGCGAPIEAGTPMQVWIWPGLRRRKVRCPACADEAPPVDLPLLSTTEYVTPTPLLNLRLMADMLPLDWKTRGAGGREPGEEG
jgi:hypothetical protein